MKTPFTVDQFLEVFKTYNESVFPAQAFFYLVAIAAIYLAARRSARSSKIISVILSFFWLWMGVVYHLIFFSTINKGAYLFAALFILQSALLLFQGVLRAKLSFRFDTDAYGITGVALIFYGLFVYPVYGYFNGHVYPYAPTFGLPCPTTIFTFGILLFTDKNVPVISLVVPMIWSTVGLMAAVNLGFTEDIGLLVAGVITVSLLAYRSRSDKQIKAAQDMAP